MAQSSSRGPWLMIAASGSFTVMIALVKLARDWGHTTAELMGWRSLLGIPVLLLVSRSWRVQRPDLLLLRCGFGFCAMFCYYSATAGLGIGELSILTKLQPLLVALLAPLVLGDGERPSGSTWLALTLGLLGTAAIAWPSTGDTEVRMFGVLAGLGAAVFSTLAHTTLRALREESAEAIVFWFQLAIGSGACMVMFGQGEQVVVPTSTHLLALGGIGASAMLGQLLMTRAYAADGAARVAAAGFVAPLLGFGADVVLFAAWPTLTSLVGMGLILAAGWVLLRGR